MASACANVGVITGGDRDIQKPSLLSSDPSNATINFSDESIVLTFDENIQVDDLKNQLIISPSVDKNSYNYSVKRNTLTLTFDEPLEENTTYTINLRESVKDVTEGNVSEKIDFAISTGDKIDSLSISGKVLDLLTGEPSEDRIVGLYLANDTLDIFNSAPRYFTQTDTAGNFDINYIRQGNYFLYAFQDENNNLKNEPADEAYGFYSDTLFLTQPLTNINLALQKLDISPLRIQSARPNGKYYVINLTKPIVSYQLEPMDTTLQLFSNLVEDNAQIRVYNTYSSVDSIAANLQVQDTIGQTINEDIFIKFTDTQRPAEAFQMAISPSTNSSIEETFVASLRFNKPVGSVNLDSIFFRYDSLNFVTVDSTDLSWSHQKDKITIIKNLPKIMMDVSITEPTEQQPTSQTNMARPAVSKDQTVEFYLGKGAFMSIENDSSNATLNKYKFKNPEDYGVLTGDVTSDAPAFIIQLLNNSNEVIDEIRNSKSYQFSSVKPGEYKMRLIIDEDNDGEWDPGNILLKTQPETVIYYPETILLRANWEVQDLNFIL